MNKPGALTPEEFDHVKTHVELSLEILSPIKPSAHVLPAVAHHHEHFDGNGYPEQLSGEDISPAAASSLPPMPLTRWSRRAHGAPA